MTVQPGTLPDNMNVVVDDSGHQLDHSHRCDRCGSRAYVNVVLESNDLELFFCRHHWLQYGTALMPQCWYINDETRQLFEGIKDDHWVEGQVQSLPPRQKP